MLILIQKCVKNGWPMDEPITSIDDSMLVKTEGVVDDENEFTTWQEWRLDGEIVKRSAQVNLKKGLVIEGITVNF